MKPAAIGTVLVLLAASPAATAQQEKPAPPVKPGRLVAGANLTSGAFGDKSVATPGGGSGNSGTIIRFGVSLAIERHVFNRWWLGVSGGVSEWTSGAALDVGYTYWRADVGLVPRLELVRSPPRRVMMVLDLAFPIGLSKTSSEVPPRRAFSEQVDSAWGWYGGGTLSATVLFGSRRRPWVAQPGARFEVGYLRHANSRRTTFTPADPAAAPIVENTDVVDQDLTFMLAAVVAF